MPLNSATRERQNRIETVQRLNRGFSLTQNTAACSGGIRYSPGTASSSAIWSEPSSPNAPESLSSFDLQRASESSALAVRHQLAESARSTSGAVRLVPRPLNREFSPGRAYVQGARTTLILTQRQATSRLPG